MMLKPNMPTMLILLLSAFSFSAGSDEWNAVNGASRKNLERPPETKIDAPPLKGEGFRDLVLHRNGPLIRFDWIDSSGKPQWLMWEESFWLKLIVEASVVAQTDDLLSYEYIVHVAADSRQPFRRLIVGANADVISQMPDGADWLTRLLPTDVWKRKLYGWSRNEARMIPPGASVEPLLLGSKGQPGLAECWASATLGGNKGSVYPIEPVEEAFYKYQRGVLDNSVHGVTVGPQEKPPKLVDFVEFLRVSREQGWVAKGTAHEGLKALVDAALKAEEISDHDALRVHLKAIEDVIEEYLAADPPQVTTEVQALLGLNAAYMRKTLSENSATASEHAVLE